MDVNIKASVILKNAKELLTPQENFTQGAYAKNEGALPVDFTSRTAVCFCSIGAIGNVLNKAGISCSSVKASPVTKSTASKYLSIAIGKPSDTPGVDIVDYNDSHSHEEVLAMFDKAISIAEKAEA